MQPTIKLKWHSNVEDGVLYLVCNNASVAYMDDLGHQVRRVKHCDYNSEGEFIFEYEYFDYEDLEKAMTATETEVRKWLASMGILTAALEFDRSAIIN